MRVARCSKELRSPSQPQGSGSGAQGGKGKGAGGSSLLVAADVIRVMEEVLEEIEQLGGGSVAVITNEAGLSTALSVSGVALFICLIVYTVPFFFSSVFCFFRSPSDNLQTRQSGGRATTSEQGNMVSMPMRSQFPSILFRLVLFMICLSWSVFTALILSEQLPFLATLTSKSIYCRFQFLVFWFLLFFLVSFFLYDILEI